LVRPAWGTEVLKVFVMASAQKGLKRSLRPAFWGAGRVALSTFR
jgi:hypothetical protein